MIFCMTELQTPAEDEPGFPHGSHLNGALHLNFGNEERQRADDAAQKKNRCLAHTGPRFHPQNACNYYVSQMHINRKNDKEIPKVG